MTKILVLYYSMYGHIETMAEAVAEGTLEVDGVDVVIKRVPELMDEQTAERAGGKLDQPAPLASPSELADYDAVIFGTPTRFGNMAAQMRQFLDQTGKQWMNGDLIGKVGSVFTSSATGAGNETTITSFWNTLAHQGMVIVGVPYAIDEMNDISEVRGGGPYGAATFAAPDGSRQPSEKELRIARFQGKHVAQIAARLAS